VVNADHASKAELPVRKYRVVWIWGSTVGGVSGCGAARQEPPVKLVPGAPRISAPQDLPSLPSQWRGHGQFLVSAPDVSSTQPRWRGRSSHNAGEDVGDLLVGIGLSAAAVEPQVAKLVDAGQIDAMMRRGEGARTDASTGCRTCRSNRTAIEIGRPGHSVPTGAGQAVPDASYGVDEAGRAGWIVQLASQVSHVDLDRSTV